MAHKRQSNLPQRLDRGPDAMRTPKGHPEYVDVPEEGMSEQAALEAPEGEPLEAPENVTTTGRIDLSEITRAITEAINQALDRKMEELRRAIEQAAPKDQEKRDERAPRPESPAIPAPRIERVEAPTPPGESPKAPANPVVPGVSRETPRVEEPRRIEVRETGEDRGKGDEILRAIEELKRDIRELRGRDEPESGEQDISNKVIYEAVALLAKQVEMLAEEGARTV